MFISFPRCWGWGHRRLLVLVPPLPLVLLLLLSPLLRAPLLVPRALLLDQLLVLTAMPYVLLFLLPHDLLLLLVRLLSMACLPRRCPQRCWCRRCRCVPPPSLPPLRGARQPPWLPGIPFYTPPQTAAQRPCRRAPASRTGWLGRA